MKLIMASVVFLAILVFQTTLIYGKENLASAANNKHKSGNGKKHSALKPSNAQAQLMMSFESGDVLMRAARGASDTIAAAGVGTVDMPTTSNAAETKLTAASSIDTNAASAGSSVLPSNRGKNNKNKKTNKHLPVENAPNTRRKHLLKKQQQMVDNQQLHSQQNQRTHHHHHNNNNNKNKQRQLLKAQMHQHQGKRPGSKAKAEQQQQDKDKTNQGDKIQSTCRYAKSIWSECDAKTNMRSRTLTLKKGEANCLPTRTVQKKCKKACRYDKGAWSECTNGQMTRHDNLKSTGASNSNTNSNADSNCEAVRTINKKCKLGPAKGNKERKNKDKGSRRTAETQA